MRILPPQKERKPRVAKGTALTYPITQTTWAVTITARNATTCRVRTAGLHVTKDTNSEKEDTSLVSISPVRVDTSIAVVSNNVPTTVISVVKVDTNIVMVINSEKEVISVAKVSNPVKDTNNVRVVISPEKDTNPAREVIANKALTIVPVMAISSAPVAE